VSDRVLTKQDLNRALLARQLLLERAKAPIPRAVERLAGLQAQHTSSPYLQLWTRLAGFERDQLTRALERRKLVKALLMRGTLHLVTPADYWAFAAARRELGGILWPPAFEKLVPKAKLTALARVASKQLGEEPRTQKEMLAAVAPHARGQASPTFLWRRLQGHAYLVHVPPSGTWGYHRDAVYAAAESWLGGEPPDPEAAFDHLVRRYLAAFGPATKHDVAQWAGIPRITPIDASLARLKLRTFRDERGRTLYDVPRAPLPDPDTLAPVRLVPRFDNLVLAHADRTRILGDVPVTRIVTKNAIVHATILVDGFVAGTWQLQQGRVVLEPFARLTRATRAALADEAAQVEDFVAG
jgi:hypothetical protein